MLIQNLKLGNVNKANDPNGVTVNSDPNYAYNGYALKATDLVATNVANASADIQMSNGQCAANVRDANSTITVFIPPSYSLNLVYYNYSYRYKLSTPGGYVGIRG